jgi:hypothetical protein
LLSLACWYWHWKGVLRRCTHRAKLRWPEIRPVTQEQQGGPCTRPKQKTEKKHKEVGHPLCPALLVLRGVSGSVHPCTHRLLRLFRCSLRLVLLSWTLPRAVECLRSSTTLFSHCRRAHCRRASVHASAVCICPPQSPHPTMPRVQNACLRGHSARPPPLSPKPSGPHPPLWHPASFSPPPCTLVSVLVVGITTSPTQPLDSTSAQCGILHSSLPSGGSFDPLATILGSNLGESQTQMGSKLFSELCSSCAYSRTAATHFLLCAGRRRRRRWQWWWCGDCFSGVTH